MNEKNIIYPPIIDSSLPPIEQVSDEVFEFTLPIIYNRFNSAAAITGVRIHFVSTVTGQSFGVIDSQGWIDQTTKTQATFSIEKLTNEFGEEVNANEKFLKGNFYKIQACFIFNTASGFDYSAYSTFGVAKVIKKTDFKVVIGGLDNTTINYARGQYKGQFEFNDPSERVKEYRFLVYKNNEEIYIGDFISHDSSTDYINTVTNKLEGYDFFDLYLEANELDNYEIYYEVKTINNLILQSDVYKIDDYYAITSVLHCNIKAEQNEETNGIDIYIEDNSGHSGVVGKFLLLRSEQNINTKVWSTPKEVMSFDMIEEAASVQIVIPQKVEWEPWGEDEEIPEGADPTGHNKVVEPETIEWMPRLLWQDYTAEQGIKYRYLIQQYGTSKTNGTFYYSTPIVSNEIVCNLEYACLYDGEKQLLIKYNPKVASFKTTKIDTKQDTIGGKYPFIFRGANTNYKEFTISGLISYTSDLDGIFLKENKIDFNTQRKYTPSIENDEIESIYDLSSTNFAKERRFKLAVLDWLNDGKPKLFRSPAEGNYLVRLMNVSLTPNDQLSRMVHTFQCTAYEIAPFDFSTMVDKKILRRSYKNFENTILTQKKLTFDPSALPAEVQESVRTGQTFHWYAIIMYPATNGPTVIYDPTSIDTSKDVVFYDVRFENLSEGDMIKFVSGGETKFEAYCGGNIFEYNFQINDRAAEAKALLEANSETERNNIKANRITGHFEFWTRVITDKYMTYTLVTERDANKFTEIDTIDIQDVPLGYYPPSTTKGTGTEPQYRTIMDASKTITNSTKYYRYGNTHTENSYPSGQRINHIQYNDPNSKTQIETKRFYKLRFVANYFRPSSNETGKDNSILADPKWYDNYYNEYTDYWIQINDDEPINLLEPRIYEINDCKDIKKLKIGRAIALFWSGRRTWITRN